MLVTETSLVRSESVPVMGRMWAQ